MIFGKEVRELLQKKDANKLSNYFSKAAKKIEKQSDSFNLIQIWLHSMLYLKNIYPKQAFSERNYVGVQVFVASSPPLKEYLDEFMSKVKPLISQINCISVSFTDKQEKILETNTLLIEESRQKMESMEGPSPNHINLSLFQKDLFLREFIEHIMKGISHGYVRKEKEEVFFSLSLGNKFYGKYDYELTDYWKLQNEILKDERRVCQLNLQGLSVIYQKS